MATTPRTVRRSEPDKAALKSAAAGPLRELMPPITLKLIFLALLGVLVFFCGIVVGFWLIIRFRRHSA